MAKSREDMKHHDEIVDEQKQMMNDIARILDAAFSPLGFALLVFDKEGDDRSRMNYICNCDRSDMVVALKELVANFEGRAPVKGHA